MVHRSKHALLAILVLFEINLVCSATSLAYPQTTAEADEEPPAFHKDEPTPNLIEQVPEHYLGRYRQWKAIFLSSPTGQNLWQKYAADPRFHLTIVVSKDQGRGAKVEGYKWENGKLMAATIVLGSQLNYGYPGQQYYPVLGSLAFTRYPWEERSDFVLAAAKIAHEFGHIDNTASSNSSDYQLRNELLDVYASQFKSNGYDADDPYLRELAEKMGGVPDQIHGQREFWAETYSLRYLLDKLGGWERRQLVRLVKKSLDNSAQYSGPSLCEWTSLTASDRLSKKADCKQSALVN